MAKLRSLALTNYRRYAGEIELPLDPGVNLVHMPPGMGKTTILEAISWCLLGTELVAEPGQVPNAEALGMGMAEVRVAMTFINGERLERFALYSMVEDEVKRQGWGWRLTGAGGKVAGEGDDAEEFADEAERLFPEACVHSNLISGASLARVVAGGASGPERAIQCSDTWCTSDLSIRCSMEATGLFLELCPDAPVRALGYDAGGRPEVSVEGGLSPDEVRLAVLSHALAFARESAGICPIFLDDPLQGVSGGDRGRIFANLLDSLPKKQVVLLLSDPQDIEALRATGRVDKELEIRG
ncbi:MAG: AAA family ATPase [Methanomassiliicoccus sp.]|nr:AAA family ATPase [Methanomassiliicoccus sp.]